MVTAADGYARELSLVHRAVLAPSSHNTQPWVFRIDGAVVDLFADRTRALPVNDPEDRELTISCGAALMNLRVAAAAQRVRVLFQRVPDTAQPDWVARVRLEDGSDEASAEGALVESIEERRTYRRRFSAREVDAATVDQLLDAAAREGAWLRVLQTTEARQRAATLVAQGDAAQWANPSWRRELAAWMHPRRRGDGLSVPTLAAPFAQLVVRTFDMGNGVGAQDEELAQESPLLAVLGTHQDTPLDWLRAGEALQRVLLTGCRLGLQASYLNQPIQVAELRPKLGELVGGDGYPQILLRCGYPQDEVPAAPRRPLVEVIEPAT